MPNNENLIDIDSDFEEGKSKSIILTGYDALRNKILNLFSSSSEYEDFLGDRPYENGYGCNLERSLFEPVDTFTADDILDTIYDSVTTFIPEVFVTRDSIIVQPLSTGDGYYINIVYIYQGNSNFTEFVIKK